MNKKVILVVEDNLKDEALTLRALKAINIFNDVVVTRDGPAALDYIFGTGAYQGRDPNDNPQFILLDLKLPKMSGLEVLKQIRADDRTRNIPVVIFTASTEDEDLVTSYNLGANSFVRKPIEPKQFLAATKQLGLYWIVLNEAVKILIVDAHEVVRDGVMRILDEQHRATIFGEAGTGAEAMRLVREEDWDVAIIDPHLDLKSELEILKEVKQIRPRLPVLILSMHAEEHFARRALNSGAAGYITKDCPREELARAVNKVVSGGRYVSAALAEKLIFNLDMGSGRPLHEDLSDREFEVLSLIASGKTVGEIADILSLSDSTISTYRARILEKMRMKTNAELTHYAILNRLVD